ncbi:hypothetical protein [Tessaracoccus lacteus]|uniref:Uncharacterized protein n=1 Tax=Tessaracoccus lacteus TaxID=3041766 RepID=A0ABY8PVN4_9ACTN|nr:hypothetical protein [Tessaracoccus sp. T21]WGT46493.1 hypothetical protein QH948_10090 [Tessaracoccus sp. T21]
MEECCPGPAKAANCADHAAINRIVAAGHHRGAKVGENLSLPAVAGSGPTSHLYLYRRAADRPRR